MKQLHFSLCVSDTALSEIEGNLLHCIRVSVLEGLPVLVHGASCQTILPASGLLDCSAALNIFAVTFSRKSFEILPCRP